MKLYKGEKVMQMVDKEQVEICLDAGWSRSKPEPEPEEEVVEEVEEEPEPEPAPRSVPKKIKTRSRKK